MSGLDLYLAQRTLALLFVYAAWAGFGMGVVYDILRISRMLLGAAGFSPSKGGASRTGKGRILRAILLFAEDVLFMLVASVTLILLCYYANDGQIRALAVVGMLGGYFVYVAAVSPWFIRLIGMLLHLLHRLLRACVIVLLVPLRGLWSRTAGRWLMRGLRKRKERMTQKNIQLLTDAASRGFGIAEEESDR